MLNFEWYDACVEDKLIAIFTLVMSKFANASLIPRYMNLATSKSIT